MSLPTASPVLASADMLPASSPAENIPRVWAVGTLRYDQRQLFILFFWLMWNDFSILLIESVTSLTQVLYQDHGATYTQMAIFGSTAGYLTMWINPWCSTWSDRHRGRWGRRRPFLFAAVPLFALTLISLPFMPQFSHFAMQFAPVAALIANLHISGPVLFVGIASLLCGMCNAMVTAIFSYLYFDVVPEKVMGRFQSMTKIMALVVAMVWNFFIFGQATHHIKAVFVCTAAFCLAIYLLSTWQIKEGEYPPPDRHAQGGVFAPIRAYFVECFSDPFYLWIFAAFALYNINGVSSQVQFAYIHYDLKLDLDAIGKINFWSSAVTLVLGLIFGFAFGSLMDRIKPVRMMAPLYALWALAKIGGFICVHDWWSYLGWMVANNTFGTAVGIVQAAIIIEVFPREKLGQFCSANAITMLLVTNTATLIAAFFFDHLKNDRCAFLWQAVFLFVGALAFIKVHANWQAKRGLVPLPHAG
jgi:MFS family permease